MMGGKSDTLPARRSRFSGKLVLVLLDDRDHTVTRDGRALWAVEREISYRTISGDPINVPAGFVTDLASVPRAVWSFYPPDGPWVKAAVVHDFLYFTKGTGSWKDKHGLPMGTTYTRRASDAVLLEGMEDRNVGPWERFVIWAAVRLGGAGGWGR